MTNVKRKINFAMKQDELDNCKRIKEKYGFTTITGMLKFMLNNADNLLKDVIKIEK